MNLDEIMVAQISKVAREIVRQRQLRSGVFLDQMQKERAGRIREVNYQIKCRRDKKRLEQSGYREIIDTLVQRLNHNDTCYIALKRSLRAIICEIERYKRVNFSEIIFSASTAEELPHCVILYYTVNSIRDKLLDISYDDNGQAVVWIYLSQHTRKIILSPEQSHAAEEIINFLMTT